MPKGPKGEKRPADVIGAAVRVMKIATGEIEEDIDDDRQDRGEQPAHVGRCQQGVWLWLLDLPRGLLFRGSDRCPTFRATFPPRCAPTLP